MPRTLSCLETELLGWRARLRATYADLGAESMKVGSTGRDDQVRAIILFLARSWNYLRWERRRNEFRPLILSSL